MSYSVTWNEGVAKDNLDHDLSLAQATVSPPYENAADDVKVVIEAAAYAAAQLVASLPDPPSGKFKVSAYGHVRQGETDTSTANISVGELVEVLPTAEEAAAQIGAVEPDIETTEPPASG